MAHSRLREQLDRTICDPSLDGLGTRYRAPGRDTDRQDGRLALVTTDHVLR